jgi:hypothetical protein
MPQKDQTQRKGILLTTAARTLVDLGAVASEQEVEAALENALRRGLVTLPALRDRLADLGASGRNGVGTIRHLLDVRGDGTPPTESELETLFLPIIRRAGLPPPHRQFVVRDHRRFVARVDFAYPERQLAIEVLGAEFHLGKDAWHNDMARRNQLVLVGWKVIELSWLDAARRPVQAAGTLRDAWRRAA